MNFTYRGEGETRCGWTHDPVCWAACTYNATSSAVREASSNAVRPFASVPCCSMLATISRAGRQLRAKSAFSPLPLTTLRSLSTVFECSNVGSLFRRVLGVPQRKLGHSQKRSYTGSVSVV